VHFTLIFWKCLPFALRTTSSFHNPTTYANPLAFWIRSSALFKLEDDTQPCNLHLFVVSQSKKQLNGDSTLCCWEKVAVAIYFIKNSNSAAKQCRMVRRWVSPKKLRKWAIFAIIIGWSVCWSIFCYCKISTNPSSLRKVCSSDLRLAATANMPPF